MPSPADSRATTLSRNIRSARVESGLSQREVAVKLGIDSMMVSKWERGWHRPSDENLRALARLLGRSPADLHAESERTAA